MVASRIQSADNALMSNNLTKLPWLIRLSRRPMRIIQQNIWFSLIVKALFVLLTFGGYSTLWGAIAAVHAASSYETVGSGQPIWPNSVDHPLHGHS